MKQSGGRLPRDKYLLNCFGDRCLPAQRCLFVPQAEAEISVE